MRRTAEKFAEEAAALPCAAASAALGSSASFAIVFGRTELALLERA